MIRVALLAAFSLATMGLSPALGQNPQRFELGHLAKLINLQTPQFSPDGRSVAIVVSRPNFSDNRRDTELVLVDVATAGLQVLVRDRYDIAQHAWSREGDRLAFLAKTDTTKESKAQLYVLSLAEREARQLTNAPRGVQHFAWRPDGSAIAYATDDVPPKGEGEERHNAAFEIGENDMFLTAAPNPVHICWRRWADRPGPETVSEGITATNLDPRRQP